MYYFHYVPCEGTSMPAVTTKLTNYLINKHFIKYSVN